MVENLKQAPPPLAAEETLELHGMVFDQWRSPTPLFVNVLTGATKILPPPQSSRFRRLISIHLCMTFLANANNTGYYVVLYDRVRFIYVEVYSSDTGSLLTVLDCHTPSIHFPVTTDVQSGDLFWFLDGDCAVKFPCNERFSECINGILAYNVQADAWSKVSVDFPPDAYGAYALITKHKGCLVLVDLVDSPKSRYPREIMGAVGIWVMQQSSSSPGTASWVQVARTPPQYWEGFYDIRPGSAGVALRGYLFVKFLSFGVCMTGAILDHETNYEGDYFTPLVYDLDLDSWYHLPAYKGNLDAMGLFAFQPAFPMN